MPQQFGTVFRSYVVKSNAGYGACLYTICRDSNLNLINTPGVVNNNIKTYLERFKSFSDTIEIKNGKIANIGTAQRKIPTSPALPFIKIEQRDMLAMYSIF